MTSQAIMSSSEVFARKLLAVAPELTSVYEEHLRDHGEVLGHVFMADVTRLIVEHCRKSVVDENSTPFPVDALLNLFDQELASGDPLADDMIALSFCENLADEESALKILRPRMGAHLSAALKQVLGE